MSSHHKTIPLEVVNHIKTNSKQILGATFWDTRLEARVEAGWKQDRLEQRTLVISKFRLFFVSGRHVSKLQAESSFHLLSLRVIEIMNPQDVKCVLEDGRRLYVRLVEEGVTSQLFVLKVLEAFKHYFPCCTENLKNMVELKPSALFVDWAELGQSRPSLPCANFRRTYAALCDMYRLPFRDEVGWDVDKIYACHSLHVLRLEDFNHLYAKDLIPIIAVLQFNSWFTGLHIENYKITSDMQEVIEGVLRHSQWLKTLWLRKCGLKSDFLTNIANCFRANPSIPIESIDISGNQFDDHKSGINLGNALVSAGENVREMVVADCSLTGRGANGMASGLYRAQLNTANLTTLDLSGNSHLRDESTDVFILISYCVNLEQLNLAHTGMHLEKLWSCLKYGGLKLKRLNLSGCTLGSTGKRNKQPEQPPTGMKDFFASAVALRELILVEAGIPTETLKSLLLGLASNQTISGVHLDLSGSCTQTVTVLETSFPNIPAISALTLRDNNFGMDLSSLLPAVGRMAKIESLDIGGDNFASLKKNSNSAKHLPHVLMELVKMITDEDSTLHSLKLPDCRLGVQLSVVLNALGPSPTLRCLDISGNEIGNFGARLLAKAIQVNSCLETLIIDRNHLTADGLTDIAHALKNNSQLWNVPLPLVDINDGVNRGERERLMPIIASIQQCTWRNNVAGGWKDGRGMGMGHYHQSLLNSPADNGLTTTYGFHHSHQQHHSGNYHQDGLLNNGGGALSARSPSADGSSAPTNHRNSAYYQYSDNGRHGGGGGGGPGSGGMDDCGGLMVDCLAPPGTVTSSLLVQPRLALATLQENLNRAVYAAQKAQNAQSAEQKSLSNVDRLCEDAEKIKKMADNLDELLPTSYFVARSINKLEEDLKSTIDQNLEAYKKDLCNRFEEQGLSVSNPPDLGARSFADMKDAFNSFRFICEKEYRKMSSMMAHKVIESVMYGISSQLNSSLSLTSSTTSAGSSTGGGIGGDGSVAAPQSRGLRSPYSKGLATHQHHGGSPADESFEQTPSETSLDPLNQSISSPIPPTTPKGAKKKINLNPFIGSRNSRPRSIVEGEGTTGGKSNTMMFLSDSENISAIEEQSDILTNSASTSAANSTPQSPRMMFNALPSETASLPIDSPELKHLVKSRPKNPNKRRSRAASNNSQQQQPSPLIATPSPSPRSNNLNVDTGVNNFFSSSTKSIPEDPGETKEGGVEAAAKENDDHHGFTPIGSSSNNVLHSGETKLESAAVTNNSKDEAVDLDDSTANIRDRPLLSSVAAVVDGMKPPPPPPRPTKGPAAAGNVPRVPLIPPQKKPPSSATTFSSPPVKSSPATPENIFLSEEDEGIDGSNNKSDVNQDANGNNNKPHNQSKYEKVDLQPDGGVIHYSRQQSCGSEVTKVGAEGEGGRVSSNITSSSSPVHHTPRQSPPSQIARGPFKEQNGAENNEQNDELNKRAATFQAAENLVVGGSSLSGEQLLRRNKIEQSSNESGKNESDGAEGGQNRPKSVVDLKSIFERK